MLKVIFSPVVRAVLVVGAVAGLVTGVTYAALQSEATLTNNTITAADALQVNNNPADTTFSQSEEGFAFSGIIPGVASSATHGFELKNISAQSVDVNVQIPTPPALPAGVTTEQITFTFVATDPAGSTVTATWAELTTGDGKLLFGNLAPTNEQTFTVKVDIDGAATASSVTIPAFTLLFGVPTTL